MNINGTLGLVALDNNTVDWLKTIALSIWWCNIGPNEEDEYEIKMQKKDWYKELLNIIHAG